MIWRCLILGFSKPPFLYGHVNGKRESEGILGIPCVAHFQTKPWITWISHFSEIHLMLMKSHPLAHCLWLVGWFHQLINLRSLFRIDEV